MSDIATCKAVLALAVEGRGHLYLACPPDWGMRIIPVRPKGTVKEQDAGAEWTYERKDGRLHLTPSLLCTDTGFHTAFDWDCAFVEEQASLGYARFLKENPEIEGPWK